MRLKLMKLSLSAAQHSWMLVLSHGSILELREVWARPQWATISYPSECSHTHPSVLTPIQVSSHPSECPHTHPSVLTPVRVFSHLSKFPHTHPSVLTPFQVSSHLSDVLTPFRVSSHPSDVLTPIRCSHTFPSVLIPIWCPHTLPSVLTPVRCPHTHPSVLIPVQVSSHPSKCQRFKPDNTICWWRGAQQGLIDPDRGTDGWQWLTNLGNSLVASCQVTEAHIQLLHIPGECEIVQLLWEAGAPTLNIKSAIPLLQWKFTFTR